MLYWQTSLNDRFVEYIADAVTELQGQESTVLPALRKQLSEAEHGIINMPRRRSRYRGDGLDALASIGRYTGEVLREPARI